ncbi:MAG: hypothetical protein AAGG81_03265 [Chlamydiota bacterium]
MEDKKSQNKRSTVNHSNTENYQAKNSKQKKRSSLVKRRNTAITMSVLSSVILAGIGYEIVSSLNDNSAQPNIQTEKKIPLRILAEEEDFIGMSLPYSQSTDLDFDEEVNIIQQLTRHKNLQSKKIRELKEDLEEAKSRIIQLKTDILIKGGEKEQHYREQIDNFNRQLSSYEQQNTNLQAEIAVRDKLINSKRSELESLSKIFTDTHEQLKTELSNRESEIDEEMTKTQRIFDELREELTLTDREIRSPEEVRDAFRETTKRIAELEAIIEQASNESLEANSQAEEIANQLHNTEKELADAREAIQNLVLEIESRNIASQLSDDEEMSSNTFVSTQEQTSQILETAQAKILEKQQELEKVERRLQQALVDYTQERSRANRLSNKLMELESSTLNEATLSNLAVDNFQQQGSTNYANFINQQERLIKDLQRNLNNVERRNDELKRLLDEKKNYVDEFASDETILILNQELFNSQEKVRELESDLHQLRIQQNYDYVAGGPLVKNTSEDRELKNLLEERNTLLTQVYEYRNNIHNQQNKILSLQKNLEEATSMNQEWQTSYNEDELSELKTQVILLEKTLAETENKLQEAISTKAGHQREDTSLLEMEEFYDTKLTQLVKANQVLEEQLEEAEEYIQLTREQLSHDHDQINSLHEQMSKIQGTSSTIDDEVIQTLTRQLQTEMDQREDLEMELTQLRAQFHKSKPEMFANSERKLKDQIEELQLLYQDEQQKSTQLESQLETLSRLVSNLQEEMTAQESAIPQSGETSTPSKLRAKIAYLTTRLEQEKTKLSNSEEKLQEMVYTITEMKDRNRELEEKLHYR